MTTYPITKLGSSNPIYLLLYLPTYGLIVCQVCQYACLASEATTYLTTKHHNIDPATRHRKVVFLSVRAITSRQ
ncbi:hypothetical protein FOXYSP1_14325 [Fusarium oxysporum f. sp. phaseoli]